MPAYFQGLAIGLAYVAPIGMQNLFVINSALAQPRRRALLTALIVTLFDVSLAFACYFGIGALVERFVWLQLIVLLAGGCVVIWIGAGLLREKPSLDRAVDTDIPISRIAAKSFVVTWINPQASLTAPCSTAASASAALARRAHRSSWAPQPRPSCGFLGSPS